MKLVHLDRQLKLLKIKFLHEKLRMFLHFQVGLIFLLIVFTSRVICVTIHPNNHSFFHRLECVTFICGIPIVISSYRITQFINLINMIANYYERANVYFIESIKTMSLRLAITKTSGIYSEHFFYFKIIYSYLYCYTIHNYHDINVYIFCECC